MLGTLPTNILMLYSDQTGELAGIHNTYFLISLSFVKGNQTALKNEIVFQLFIKVIILPTCMW